MKHLHRACTHTHTHEQGKRRHWLAAPAEFIIHRVLQKDNREISKWAWWKISIRGRFFFYRGGEGGSAGGREGGKDGGMEGWRRGWVDGAEESWVEAWSENGKGRRAAAAFRNRHSAGASLKWQRVRGGGGCSSRSTEATQPPQHACVHTVQPWYELLLVINI